jgi:hypothetical protein
MGRFISADTIIPDPANPQSLNRYSYCLNNPLKYIDPSGHKVYVNDWNVESIRAAQAAQQAGYWLPPGVQQALNEVVNSPEYQAYDEFRKQTQDDPMRAQTLEQSEKIITIGFDDLGYSLDSTTRKNGDNYEIVLNNNMYNNLTRADSWFLAGEINKQVEDSVLFCYPNLFNKETMPHPVDLIPYIGGIDSWVTAVAHYRWGWTDKRDLTVSTISSGMGLIPGYGLFLGYVGMAGETIYNMWKYGTEFYNNADKYGYSFR